MGKKFTEISEAHRGFIEEQRIFFVATAAAEGRVNLSPKGLDTLRLTGPNRVLWLNLTGSGNETAAHLLETGRMTLMFCAFQGDPRILRLYGWAEAYHPEDGAWNELLGIFPILPGARQIIDMRVDLVHTSCGFGVPLFDYRGDRGDLNAWAERRGEDGVAEYWNAKNSLSIDGKPTGITAERGDRRGHEPN